MEQLFFELIRIAVGTKESLTRIPSEAEWGELFALAEKQALTGICFAGISSIANPDKMDFAGMSKEMYQRWIIAAYHIQQKNRTVTRAVGTVRDIFNGGKFDCILLKGQGNLCNYPKMLQDLRTPGDIDMWILPKDCGQRSLKYRLKNDEHVLKWIWSGNPSLRHCYIHTDYPKVNGVNVELHFRPSYINSRRHDRRFQRWAAGEAPLQASNIVTLPDSDVRIAVPTSGFNTVYQLTHLYRHLFDDGLGLRQVIDFHFVLAKLPECEKARCLKTIKELGMKRFLEAIIHVLDKVVNGDAGRNFCRADAKAGDFLLNELMEAGNFGRYDKRQEKISREGGLQRLVRRQKRNMRFFFLFPTEVLSVPVYRVYQELWRLKMNIKCRHRG